MTTQSLQQSRLLLFLILQTLLFFSSSSNILPGSTLRASNPNQTWTSPKGTFSLGFTSSTSSCFIAAISYNSAPIWIAGGDESTVDRSSTFELSTSGNLRLLNGSGAVVWHSNTANHGVTTATLDDSGDLVLRNASSAPIWSSFDYPTDTIVPSQNFSVDKTLRTGLYSFYLQSSGNITLSWNSSIVYWTLGLNSTFNATLNSPYLNLQAIGILSLLDSSLSNSVIMAYSSDYAEGGDMLRFVKLDDDGNLRIYSYPKRGGSPTIRWSAVQDQCQVFGYCGNLGICTYNDSSPICTCPSQNFVSVNPSDPRKGCRRKTEIADCPGSSTMLELDNARFLTYTPELSSQVFFVGISACRLNCLNSGSCIASTSLSDGTGLCYLKNPGFISGYQSPSLSSISYLKVCSPLVPNPPQVTPTTTKKKIWTSHGWIVGIMILSSLICFILLEALLWRCFCKTYYTPHTVRTQYALLEYASGAPVQFSYKDLQRATNFFKEKLGEGGFGSVYRGILSNRTIAAIKQLEGIEQGEKQFRMEVATISSTHHLNLIRLIGFCSEGRHRLLVYEFMNNGSLDHFLFSTDPSSRVLSWEERFKIGLGTARGITYLHEECRDCIVHCDIKPENILIDENYRAKVSDFGLAKLVSPKDHRHRTLTSVRGTRGYLAPEWLANLPITSKSDVYSYGMVLMEIVGGRRNFEISTETNFKKFSVWAFEEFEKGNASMIMDSRMGDEVDMDEVMRAIQVSFWCIQEQPSLRPTMGKVVQMLEGITEIENPSNPKAAITFSSSSAVMERSGSGNLPLMVTSVLRPSSSSSLKGSAVSSFVSGGFNEG